MQSVNQKESNTENFNNEDNNQLTRQPSNSLPATSSSSLLVSLTRNNNNNRNPALHPTREDSPYPGREELAAASTLHSLAESATNASLRLQHQLNLMAQAIATPGATATSFPLLSNTNSISSSPLPNVGQSIGCDSTNGLSAMFDHYVAAVSTAVAIQQQQQRQDVASVYNTSPNLVTSYSTPLSTYFSTQQNQQSQNLNNSTQIPLAFSQQQSLSIATTNDQQGGNISNSLPLTPVPALCSCTLPSMFAAAAATSMAVAAAGVCPYHQTSMVRPLTQELQIDLNNNNSGGGSRQQTGTENSGNTGDANLLSHRQRQAQIFQIPNPGFQQQQQLVTSVPTSISIPPVGVIQPIHHSPPARLTRSIASSSSSSLKRSNATAFPPNLEAVSSAMLTTINNTINVSSPPPLLYANSTQIRLATGEALNVAMRQRIDEFNESSSRAPKLRRILTFDDDVSEVNESSVNPSIVPSITAISQPESDIEATNNVTAAALVQLRQRAQTLAAISLPAPLNEMLSIASTVSPNVVQSSALNSLQQNQTAAVPLQNQQSTTAAAIVAASTISSVAAGMEQIVAAALSAANAATALSPHALAALTGATAAVQCAVCAAAACQSRLSNPGSTPAPVTACSCLHHHHHHLHCHHHQPLLPHQSSPICTLCNSNNVTNGAPTPSSNISNQNTNNNSTRGGITVENTPIGVVRPQQSGNAHQSRTSNLCSSSSSNLHNLFSSNLEIPNNTIDESNQHSQRFVLNTNDLNQTLGHSNSAAYQFLLDAYNTNNLQRQPQSSSVSIGINIGAPNLSTSTSSLCDSATSTDSSGQQTIVNFQQQIQAQQQAMNNVQQQIHAQQQAASLSPSAVTAMLLNSAAAMGQQQTMPAVPAQQQQQIPSLFSLQRGATFNENNLMAQVQAQQSMNTVQQSLLAIRLAQQEREREAANQFYQQQQRTAQAAAVAAAQHRHLMRPLIMMPQTLPVQMTQMDLSSLVLLHNHPGAETALVLNGGGSATTNPHHIVANAMAAATAAEPQPIGATLEQIKRHSQKLSYVEDPNISEQERERCTICLCEFETGDELRGLNCGHLFHMECIDPWLQQNKKCPLCRVDMDKGISVPGSSNALVNVGSAAEAAVILNAAAYASATSSTGC